MNVVTVVEHEAIQVVARLDHPDQKAITLKEIDGLLAIEAKLGVRVAEYVARDRVKFQQFVGLARLSGRDFEFLPKIESQAGDEPKSLVRHNLLHMLLAAFDIEVHVPGLADATLSEASWLDSFIRVFCLELAEQVRRGLMRRYRTEEDDLPTLRGRLVVSDQLRRNFIHRERLACKFDELDENHPLNQVFKHTLNRMALCVRSVTVQRSVWELQLAFDSVSNPTLPRGWWRKVTLDRLTTRFAQALRMAQMFLDGASPDVAHGYAESYALLFDMNDLFEKFVGRELRRCLQPLGLRVHLQHARHHLMWDPSSKANLFALRPDVVVFSDVLAVCICDTKWKRLSPDDRKLGVQQGDLYQMLAYADRYACDTILLVYPYQSADGRHSSSHRLLRYQGRNTGLLVGQLALGDLGSVGGQLMAMFDQGTAALA
jgi:5-methylcytosine-specific restriction enzyme subunit McrC